MDYVVKVECVDITKKQQPGGKQLNLYHLQVTWSNKNITRVGRPYTEFFDYMKTIQKAAETRKDVIVPDLPGKKQFEKGLFGTKESKKKKTIDDFCQAILKLPEDLARSPKVTEFFKPAKTIELRLDTLQHVSGIPNEMSDLIQQLRSHSHTDNKGPGGVKSPPPNMDSPPPNMDAADRGPVGRDGTCPPLLRTVSCEDNQSSVYSVTSNYNKQRDNEVDLRAGTKVDVLQKDLTGWWFVCVEDTEEQGWAPGSLLEASNPSLDTNIPPQGKDDSNLYRATRSHKAKNSDEVSYEAGDLAEVIEFKMDGWWKVRHKGKEGMMPAIHLEPVTREKGQTKKIASSLYHHNSIYSKSSPPPRRTTRISEMYAKVNKPSHKPLTYAQIEFENVPGTGENRPVIIMGDSDRTQYTEVLPIGLPPKQGEKDLPPKQVEKTPAAKKETSASGRRPQSATGEVRSNYMNWRATSVPAASGYMNVTINKDEAPRLEVHVYEVIADHHSLSMHNERLLVKRGDFVQADKVEATRALCYILDDDRPMSTVKGWIPIEKLKSSYTAVTPGRNSLCPDNVDIDRLPSRTPSTAPTCGSTTHPLAPPSPCKGAHKHPLSSPGETVTGHAKAFQDSFPNCSVPVRMNLPPNKPELLTINCEPQKPSRDMPPEPCLPSPKPPTTPSGHKSGPWDDPSQESVIVQAMWDSPSQQDGVLAFKRGDKARLLCKNNKGWWGVLCDTQRGWVPSAYWEITEVRPMVPPKSPDPPPKSPTESIGGQGHGQSKHRHLEAHLNQRWFVGKMSRTECEALFTNQAKDNDFVIRESTYRIGHYTLSVQHDSRMRHFPIILTDDEKYYIGKHNFRNLCHIVTYYQKNPLFYNDNEHPVSLGNELIISEC